MVRGTGATFVGREGELALVDEALRAADAGRAALVLCRGEPGIGKTRLAEELAARAADRSTAVAWGIADDAIGTPPHWPWSQVLRSLAGSTDVRTVAQDLGLGAELGRLAPDVFPQPVRRRAELTPDDRFQLFDAVGRTLAETARRQPLAIILDDMHWADEPSLMLVHHIAVTLPHARLLLWVNARPAASPLFARLARLPYAQDLWLGVLDSAAVRRELESIVPGPVAASELAGVEALTGGNPFFVQEAGLALAEQRAGRSGHLVTPGTLSAVGARLARLPPVTQQALRAAAVLGRDFSVEDLAAMLGAPELACRDMVRHAEGEGMVEPGGARGGYRFVHALVHGALYEAMEPAVQAALHQAAAQTIERRHGGDPGPHLFEIARHWAEAASTGSRAISATWLERAADLAMDLLGFEDAARLYQEAASVGSGEIAALTRCRLFLAAARALNLCGALGESHRCRMAALDAAPPDVRTEVVAEAALAIDPVGQPGFDLVTRRLCQEALAALGDGPAPARARLTARFAETFIYLPDSGAADRASAEAVQVAEGSGDSAALVAALRARQVVVAHPDRLEERSQVADRLVALGQATGQVEAELRGRLCRVDAFLEAGALGRIGPELDAAGHLADALRSPLARFVVANTRAVLAQAQGLVTQARRLSDEAFARGGWGDHPEPPNRREAVLSGIGRHLGMDLEALALVAPPDKKGRPPFIADLAAAHALVSAGRRAEANDLWRSLGPAHLWQPPAHVVLLGAALGIETAIMLGRDDDLETLRGRIEAFRGHHVACGLGAACYLGPVELWLGKAALHQGRFDDALEALTEARSRAHASGAEGFEAEAMADLAATLARRGQAGDADTARQLAGAARAAADELGLHAIVARLQNSSVPVDGNGTGSLTPRELEVAALVAKGLTNRAVAERLVVSERTAQNHVQHILTKLGLHNRAQLAVWFDRKR